MNVDPDRHRRSIRINGYDYTQAGAYYVTIATKRRAHLFGEILEREMHLSEAGQVAEACWQAIPQHFPQTELGAFIVMPNYIHGIIILHDRAYADARGAAMAASPPVGARQGGRLKSYHDALESRRLIPFTIQIAWVGSNS